MAGNSAGSAFFSSGRNTSEAYVEFAGKPSVPFGSDLLFDANHEMA